MNVCKTASQIRLPTSFIKNRNEKLSTHMQIIAVIFCGFMHLRYLCRKKSLEMGMIIKDLCPHIVHKKDFSVHKTLYFSNVQHLGVDWI